MSNFGEQQNIILFLQNQSHPSGVVSLGNANQINYPCAIGPGGITTQKREGDGKTPIGIWHFKELLYRQDRILRPKTNLPCRPIQKNEGWCDHVGDRNYNRLVNLPYPKSAEKLNRDDNIYDIVIILDHNQSPRIQGRGSAIFMHIARKNLEPTEGCIALKKSHLIELIQKLSEGDNLIIGKHI